jgi:hypothetical protein
VSNDWVVRYANRYFQIERQSQRPPARSTVRIYEGANGQIEIRYRDRVMRYQELAAQSLAAKRGLAPSAYQPPPAGPPVREATRADTRSGQRQQSADHPWRDQVITAYHAHRQLAKDRRAWERVQP